MYKHTARCCDAHYSNFIHGTREPRTLLFHIAYEYWQPPQLLLTQQMCCCDDFDCVSEIDFCIYARVIGLSFLFYSLSPQAQRTITYEASILTENYLSTTHCHDLVTIRGYLFPWRLILLWKRNQSSNLIVLPTGQYVYTYRHGWQSWWHSNRPNCGINSDIQNTAAKLLLKFLGDVVRWCYVCIIDSGSRNS